MHSSIISSKFRWKYILTRRMSLPLITLLSSRYPLQIGHVPLTPPFSFDHHDAIMAQADSDMRRAGDFRLSP
jgi:hypothetical protein